MAMSETTGNGGGLATRNRVGVKSFVRRRGIVRGEKVAALREEKI
jgi:hypothetical protein